MYPHLSAVKTAACDAKSAWTSLLVRVGGLRIISHAYPSAKADASRTGTLREQSLAIWVILTDSTPTTNSKCRPIFRTTIGFSLWVLLVGGFDVALDTF
jgi:hypothetical protein